MHMLLLEGAGQQGELTIYPARPWVGGSDHNTQPHPIPFSEAHPRAALPWFCLPTPSPSYLSTHAVWSLSKPFLLPFLQPAANIPALPPSFPSNSRVPLTLSFLCPDMEARNGQPWIWGPDNPRLNSKAVISRGP